MNSLYIASKESPKKKNKEMLFFLARYRRIKGEKKATQRETLIIFRKITFILVIKGLNNIIKSSMDRLVNKIIIVSGKIPLNSRVINSLGIPKLAVKPNS